MENYKNALFNQKLRALSFQLILMILLLLLNPAWALTTVPIEVDAVASTLDGASSSYLTEKGYKLSGVVLFHGKPTNANDEFRGIKLIFSSICGGAAVQQVIGNDTIISPWHTHTSATITKDVSAVYICSGSGGNMNDIWVKYEDGTYTKVMALSSCAQSRLINLNGKNMIGMALIVSSANTMPQNDFSIWVDDTENTTSQMSIASQVPDTTYTLNQGLLETAAFTVLQDSACNL